MEAGTPQFSLARIGRALGVSREAVRALKKRHDIDDATLANPDALFERLVASGHSGKVRTTLSDPARPPGDFRQPHLTIIMTKERFEQFLATGELKAEGGKLFMQRGDLTALADMARNEILTLRQNPAASAPAPARSATTPAVKPAAITPPAPVTKPATAPAAAKPAVPAITGTVTAAQFRAEQSKPTMTGAEFRSLSHTERNEWIRSGGKVAD